MSPSTLKAKGSPRDTPSVLRKPTSHEAVEVAEARRREDRQAILALIEDQSGEKTGEHRPQGEGRTARRHIDARRLRHFADQRALIRSDGGDPGPTADQIELGDRRKDPRRDP